VIALGQLLSRQHHVPNTLFLSAFVMLVIAPEWLYHIGFQMSCLAVLSIVCFYQSIEKIFHFKYELVQSVWRVIAMSLAAEIFISPLVIYYFNLFPITFILTNVIAWLAILVVMVGG